MAPTDEVSSPLTIYLTSTNFVLGAGILGIPYAVVSAGMLASVASLIAVAFLSLLTCSWLLEVGDRANALQNELSRQEADSDDEASQVQHADGGTSQLPPPAAFLRTPLLEDRSRRKLDEYRAAYRSWRTGSPQGATDTQWRKLRPHLVYQPGRHRELLPLQLRPPPCGSPSTLPAPGRDDQQWTDDERSEVIELGLALAADQQPSPLGGTACSSAHVSSQSLDNYGKRAGGARERSAATKGAVAQPGLQRSDSFSIDLAHALYNLSVRSAHDAPLECTPPSALTGHNLGRADMGRAYSPPTEAALLRGRRPAPAEGRRAQDGPAWRVLPEAPDWSVPRAISALEVTQLCNVFLGRRMRNAWISSICALHVSAMWACCAIWITCAQSVLLGASAPPDDPASWQHTLPLLALCTAVLVPLSVLGGSEIVQSPLATATLSTLVLMCVLLVWALLERMGDATSSTPRLGRVFGEPPSMAGGSGGERQADGEASFRRVVFNGRHFGPSFATFLFSFIVQQSVPSLVRRAAAPEWTRAALAASIGTCLVLYLSLGCGAALCFGDSTEPLITLNFIALRGGAPPGDAVPLWAAFASRWIMLLPLLTTTAAFPLFNRVLAANLEGLLPPRLRSPRVAAALCALPPLLCTACVRDTALVFAICGLSGFIIVFFVPSALQRAAMRASVERWGELGRATPHTTCFSHEPTVVAVMLAASCAFALNLWAVAGLLLSKLHDVL